MLLEFVAPLLHDADRGQRGGIAKRAEGAAQHIFSEVANQIDIPMDYDSVAKAGSMLGSGGMVVMDEDTCMVDMARRIMHFYAHESCGWCIPCREGTTWLRKMLDRFHAGLGRPEDIDLIGDLSKNMLGRTFCPLGDAAALPTISIVQKWRDEFEQHLNGRCPYKSAEALVGSR